MANATPASISGRQHGTVSEAGDGEKHERIARESLRSMVMFSDTLKSEIRRLTAEEAAGAPIDRALLDKMIVVKSKYIHVMAGFMELDDDEQRRALIVFADAVQDIVKHLHTPRSH